MRKKEREKKKGLKEMPVLATGTNGAEEKQTL